MERRPRISVGLVILAVAFAAVPAAFTFYPELLDLPLPIRVLVGIVWAGALVITAVVTASRDRTLDHLVYGTKAERSAAIDRCADRTFDAILDPRHIGIPLKYRVTVFLYDAHHNQLRPVYPSVADRHDDPKSFAPGVGVTGQAYRDASFLVATGRQASDATFRLTAAQQARYAHLGAVAATPVRSGPEVIGVITAAANSDDKAFNRRANQEALRSLADSVGVLIELFDLAES